jgi:hypothetical protein
MAICDNGTRETYSLLLTTPHRHQILPSQNLIPRAVCPSRKRKAASPGGEVLLRGFNPWLYVTMGQGRLTAYS